MDLNLRDVPEELVSGLKAEAALRRSSLKDYCVELLKLGLERVSIVRVEKNLEENNKSYDRVLHTDTVGGSGGKLTVGSYVRPVHAVGCKCELCKTGRG